MDWMNVFSSEDIGAHIAHLRINEGLTQADFAERIGVSRPTISSLENGGAVSARLMVKAINSLGSRLVIVPKSAAVTVRQPLHE